MIGVKKGIFNGIRSPDVGPDFLCPLPSEVDFLREKSIKKSQAHHILYCICFLGIDTLFLVIFCVNML